MKKLAIALGLAGILYGNTNAQNIDSLNKEIDTALIYKSEVYIKTTYLEDFIKKNFPAYYSERFYSKDLCINTDDKKYYVVRKNEEEGIKDIHKINKESNYEEAWLYLPEKQEWHEIGIYSDTISVLPFDFRVKKILKENEDINEIIFYHNHPGDEDIDFPSIPDLFRLVYVDTILQDYKITNKIIAKEDVVEYSLNAKGKKIIGK